jgi:hypothetical protein
MKKLLLLLPILLLALSCKKGLEPLGPTDVRIRNRSTSNMTELTVNTGGGEYNYGSLNSDTVTAYHRFDKAHPFANITAVINGQKYKTDTAIYTYMQYMGQMKITYEIFILNDAQRVLKISKTVLDEPLKKK